MASKELVVGAIQAVLKMDNPLITVDGRWGPQTQGVFEGVPASSKTLATSIAASKGFNIDDLRGPKVEDRSDYTTVVKPAVVKAARERGFASPVLLLAQLDHESGHGRRKPAPFNYAGIKYSAKNALMARYGVSQAAPVATHEGYGSKLTTVRASFAAFPSAEAFAGFYVEFLASYYPGTVSAETPDQFVQALLNGKYGAYFTADPRVYTRALASLSARNSAFA